MTLSQQIENAEHVVVVVCRVSKRAIFDLNKFYFFTNALQMQSTIYWINVNKHMDESIFYIFIFQ